MRGIDDGRLLGEQGRRLRIEDKLVAEPVRNVGHSGAGAANLIVDGAEQPNAGQLSCDRVESRAQGRWSVGLAQQVADDGERLGLSGRAALDRAVLDQLLELGRVGRELAQVEVGEPSRPSSSS